MSDSEKKAVQAAFAALERRPRRLGTVFLPVETVAAIRDEPVEKDAAYSAAQDLFDAVAVNEPEVAPIVHQEYPKFTHEAFVRALDKLKERRAAKKKEDL